MRAFFPSDYASLTQLWSLWLEQDSWPPLDKWLRNHGHLPTQPAHTLRFGQRGNALASTNKYSLNLAMISAMRYLHLACALEFAYRAKTVDVDWAEWDASWTLSAVKKVPPLAFWYWIGLRVNADTPLASPKALVDAPEREAFFQRMAADRHTATDISDAWFGMWHGLRPQWLALLAERQKASEWNQQQMETFIAQQSYTPPLWLRAQQEKTAEDLREILIAEGVDVHLESATLRAQGGRDIRSTKAYREGLVEIQDLASQLIATAVAVKPGQKVWDACAGAGGKSLAIAARMHNKGALVATDLHAYKLDELKKRAKRAQLFNVRTFVWDGEAALRLPKEAAQQQGFDWVLVDAPCSSSGTWRRNPDARWRFAPEDTAGLGVLQKKILTNAAFAVRPGGHLVYATCSWQVSENEMQVAAFLDANPGFSLVSQTMLGAPQQDSDTMFVAILVRE